MSGLKDTLAGTGAPDIDMAPPDLHSLLVPSIPVMPRMASPREYLDTPDGQTALNNLYRAATPGYNLMTDRSERILALDQAGKGTAITYSLPGDSRSVHAAIPNDAQAIVHSHPRSAEAVPSPQDYLTATKLNKPNFILSRSAIYVALPGQDPKTDQHVKVADVSLGKGGKLNIKWR